MTKKGFTLTEILIAMMIIGIICIGLIMTINPKKYSEKTNTASLMKAIEFMNQATAQMLDIEDDNFPTDSWMFKPAGGSWEFTVLNSSGASATSKEIVELYQEHLKFETGVLPFCNYTTYCNNDEIMGARVAGGAYFGIEKLDAIEDCPAYRMPYETADNPAPTVFNPKTGTYEAKKCWGKLYIDVNGNKPSDVLGEDVYVFGLGEFGIER